MDSYVTRSGGAFVKLSSRSPKDAALSSDALKILLKEGVCLPVCRGVCDVWYVWWCMYGCVYAMCLYLCCVSHSCVRMTIETLRHRKELTEAGDIRGTRGGCAHSYDLLI